MKQPVFDESRRDATLRRGTMARGEEEDDDERRRNKSERVSFVTFAEGVRGTNDGLLLFRDRASLRRGV